MGLKNIINCIVLETEKSEPYFDGKKLKYKTVSTNRQPQSQVVAVLTYDNDEKIFYISLASDTGQTIQTYKTMMESNPNVFDHLFSIMKENNYTFEEKEENDEGLIHTKTVEFRYQKSS